MKSVDSDLFSDLFSRKLQRLETALLSTLLLNYYDRESRDLPWRGERSLYRIWVSEIMLQQTGVATVIPYYHRFLKRFPSIDALASASVDAVLHAWQGLGYYQRARRLHAAAQWMVQSNNGLFPVKFSELIQLPGVGRTTAGAILAVGCGQRHAILDGNVKRVLSRLLAVDHPLSESSVIRALWSAADAFTPENRPGDYAQAIMDLGATVCTPVKPDCQRCPWSSFCLGLKTSHPENFPVRDSATSKPRVMQTALLLFRVQDGALLLSKRPEKGLLGGLWEPLSGEFVQEGDHQTPIKNLANRLGISLTTITALEPVKHVFTHFHLTVYPNRADCTDCTDCADDTDDALKVSNRLRWVAPKELNRLPLSTLHRKVLHRGGVSLSA